MAREVKEKDNSKDIELSSDPAVVEESKYKEKDFVKVAESAELQKKGKVVVEIRTFNGVKKHRLE